MNKQLALKDRVQLSQSVEPFLLHASWISCILDSALLLALLLIGFYVPMMNHFWAGMDEPVLLSINEFWFKCYDTIGSRPLAGVGAYFGILLNSKTIDGVIIVYLLLRYLTALSIIGIIKLLTNDRLLAVTSAALFIVNPMELLRFFPVFLIVYVSAVAFLLIAYYFYLVSYYKESYCLLIISCGFLAMSLLNYESGYPIAGALLLSLFFIANKKENLYFWGLAWFATLLLCSAKFLIFLFCSANTYQKSMWNSFLKKGDSFGSILFFNIKEYLFSPFLSSLPQLDSFIGFLPYTSLAVLAFFFVIYRKPFNPLLTRNQLATVSCFSFIMIVVCVSPWLFFGRTTVHDFFENPSLRYLFYAAVPQSVFIASVVYLLSAHLFKSKVIYILVMIFIFLSWATKNYEFQEHKGAINSYVDYKVISNAFQGVERIIPPLDDNAVLFFVIDKNKNSPLGWGYHVLHMSCLMFGRPGFQGFIDEKGEYHIRGITGYKDESYAQPISLKNPVVFTVDNSGNVSRVLNPPANPDANVPAQQCAVRHDKHRINGFLPYLAPNTPYALLMLENLSLIPLQRWHSNSKR